VVLRFKLADKVRTVGVCLARSAVRGKCRQTPIVPNVNGRVASRGFGIRTG
jgi:hypothetical protein